MLLLVNKSLQLIRAIINGYVEPLYALPYSTAEIHLTKHRLVFTCRTFYRLRLARTTYPPCFPYWSGALFARSVAFHLIDKWSCQILAKGSARILRPLQAVWAEPTKIQSRVYTSRLSKRRSQEVEGSNVVETDLLLAITVIIGKHHQHKPKFRPCPPHPPVDIAVTP